MKRLSKTTQNLINKYVENSLQHIKASNPQDGERESASRGITIGKETSAKTRGQGMRSTHILCSIIIAILFINCQRLPQQPFVAVNLLGYNSDDPKQTLLVNDDATGFEIIDPVNSELVYEGSITKTLSSDLSTGDRASLIVFSDFGSKGYFKLQIKDPSEIKSRQFRIGSNLYKDATFSVVQSYYYAHSVPGMLVRKSHNHVPVQGRKLLTFPGKNYEECNKNYFVNGVARNCTAISSANEVIITADS